MKALSDFLPRILPYAPGCSDPLAEQALIDAAITFCEETLVVRELLDAIPSRTDVAFYDLDTSYQHCEICRVLDVKFNGEELFGMFRDDAGVQTAESSTPSHFYTKQEDGEPIVLMLAPPPSAAAAGLDIEVNVALRPTKTATSLPDVLSTRWWEAMTFGALARILRVPNQPFSSPSGADFYERKFYAQVARARVEGGVGHVRGATSVAMRPLVRHR